MSGVPYLLAPPWARRVLYAIRASLYLALLVMGVAAVWLTPNTVSARLPTGLTDLWGALAVAGALGCLFGSLTRRYRWELFSLPILAGAVAIYAFTLWDITTDVPTRLAQASAITALLLLVLIRYVDLLVVRKRERVKHERRRRGRGTDG